MAIETQPFFHRSIAKRRRRNTILSIKDENNLVHHLSDRIAHTFVSYFRSIFATSNTSRYMPFPAGGFPPEDDPTYSIPDKQELWATLSLTPKKLVPLVPTDYRPISLCNVIYKLIAKCLANRLKPHLPDYIHPS